MRRGCLLRRTFWNLGNLVPHPPLEDECRPLPTEGEATQVGPVKKLNDLFANEIIGDQYNPNTIVAQASTPISP